MLSGMLDTYDPRHLERLHKELDQFGGSYHIIPVPARMLMNILKEHKIEKIDYLSLDTEGGEYEILRSINFEEVTIQAISVENNYKDPAIRKHLEMNGFTYVTSLEWNEVYINASTVDIAAY
jgi:hypothetical protein